MIVLLSTKHMPEKLRNTSAGIRNSIYLRANAEVNLYVQFASAMRAAGRQLRRGGWQAQLAMRTAIENTGHDHTDQKHEHAQQEQAIENSKNLRKQERCQYHSNADRYA